MRVFRKFFGFLMAVGIIIYLVFAPNIIRQGILQGRVSHWEHEKESFSGIIDMWHVVGFKAHTGSVSSWLIKQTKKLEEKHFGVYINVSAMTLDEYEARIERGEEADVYSFPSGLMYSDGFLPLDGIADEGRLSHVRDGFLKSGMYEGKLYAIPYMYSGYCLMQNTELMQKAGAQTDASAESINKVAESMAQNEKITPISGDYIYSCRYGINVQVEQLGNFRYGSTCMTLCDFREVGDAERRIKNGKGFTVTAYATDDPYTDLVQYAAVREDVETEKLEYVYEILDALLTPEAQGELAELNAYGVTGFDDVKKTMETYSSVAYDAFSVYSTPEIPNCFMYKRHRDALREDAMAALSGDGDARKRFDERMREICRGK